LAQAPSYGARGLQRVVALPESTNQTFKIGDFLTLDANGRVQQKLTTGSNLGSAAAGAVTDYRVVGRAMQSGTNSSTGGKMVDVMIAEPHTEFLLPLYHGTPASAVPSTALIGLGFELRYVAGSPNYFAIDVSATTNRKMKITDMYIPDHTGWDPSLPGFPTAVSTTQYGQVWCTFIDEQTALTGATLV
jgi:hypothetical protein